jgi:hypothetical protein
LSFRRRPESSKVSMRITRKTRKLRAAFFWTALMLMLAGPAGIAAAQGPAAPAKPAVQEPAAPAKPAAQAPQSNREEAYRYNPEGRIDPFKPFVELDAVARKKAETSKAPPPESVAAGGHRTVPAGGHNRRQQEPARDGAGCVGQVLFAGPGGPNRCEQGARNGYSQRQRDRP